MANVYNATFEPPLKEREKKGEMGKKGGYIDHSAMIFQNNYRRCPHT